MVWLLLLPLQQYSRSTYISENALLCGQVHTYFGGSEQNVFRAYRNELASVIVPPWTHTENGTRVELPVQSTQDERTGKMRDLFRNAGLKSASQKYRYESSGQVWAGENVYGVLHAPRGDGTEAFVLTAAMRNIKGELNLNGVTLLISLARYFKRWQVWSKDIIFLITPDSMAGTQAWVDAYHSQHDVDEVEDLSLKSGALQGAVSIDYPFEHRFEFFDIAYDGVNGQLPNLDLFNTAVGIAGGQMGIGNSIQSQHDFAKTEQYSDWQVRAQVMARGMMRQAMGQATGPHSVFMPYHIDAITLTAQGEGWQDEMAFGRTIESICRSINNLLEKLHQSFFFYLLMQTNRFVSIGTYLPSAMAVGAAYTVMAIYLWVMSGYQVDQQGQQPQAIGKAHVKQKANGVASGPEKQAVEYKEDAKANKLILKPVDRPLLLPIAILTTLHLISLVPLYCLSTLDARYMLPTSKLLGGTSLVVPFIINDAISKLPASGNGEHFYKVLKSLSLLLLGLFLTVLATLNFSLSFFLGLLCMPLAFVTRTPSSTFLTVAQLAVLIPLSPAGVTAALWAYSTYLSSGFGSVEDWLVKLAFGWNVWGSWGVPVGVVVVWWPAWTVAATNVVSGLFPQSRQLAREVDEHEASNGKAAKERTGVPLSEADLKRMRQSSR